MYSSKFIFYILFKWSVFFYTIVIIRFAFFLVRMIPVLSKESQLNFIHTKTLIFEFLMSYLTEEK